jgi:hypothetical protein
MSAASTHLRVRLTSDDKPARLLRAGEELTWKTRKPAAAGTR